MTTLIIRFLTVLVFITAPVGAQTVSNDVQPFVDRRELAGAVMLVASKKKILTTEAAGRPHRHLARPTRGLPR